MDMSMSMSSTASAAMATGSSASAMSMGGMGDMGGMDMGGACKISMLWNWYTLDACFISSTWQITSPGMFAGSCIGVILLTMSLSFLRRLHRAVDSVIAGAAVPRWGNNIPSHHMKPSGNDSLSSSDRSPIRDAPPTRTFHRPTVFQQALRAFLHMAQFAVAYFVMLLAMYFNGYIIICILIGAFLGYFVFEWGPLPSRPAAGKKDVTEVTGCCG